MQNDNKCAVPLLEFVAKCNVEYSLHLYTFLLMIFYKCNKKSTFSFSDIKVQLNLEMMMKKMKI
jgi:hypothetical protein